MFKFKNLKGVNMINNNVSNSFILKEIGRRLKCERLNTNLTHKELAKISSISIRTIKNVEDGKNTSITTLIEIFRALNILENFESFLPSSDVSPVQLATLKGERRKRASGEKYKNKNKDNWKW